MKKTADVNHPDFSRIVDAYRDRYGLDLSHMRMRWSKHPVYTNGKRSYELSDDETGGSWVDDGTIRINPNMGAVKRHWGLDGTAADLRRTLIAHELAHEVYNKQRREAKVKRFVAEQLAKARAEGFTTPYLESYGPDTPKDKLDNETFAEYMAAQLNKKAGYKYEDIDDESVARHKKGYRNVGRIRLLKTTRGVFVVKDGKLAGFINTERKDDGKTWVQALEVTPGFRRKGIARELLRKAVNDMGATDLTVRNTNDAARRLYDSEGWTPYKEEGIMEFRKKAETLDSSKWPSYDDYQKKHHDDTIDLIDEAMRRHFRRRRPWGVRLKGGKFVDNDRMRASDVEKLKDIIRRGIVRTGEHAVKANRGICHDLASARLKILSDMGVPARRVFIDYEGTKDPEHCLGHSMVFFKGKDGHYHHANRHMRDQNALGDFDSLEDAVRQHIADIRSSGELDDKQPISVYDNTDIEFPDEVPLKDYMRMSWEHGKRLYERGHEKAAQAATPEEIASELKKWLKYGLRYSDGTYETSPDMWDRRDARDIVVQTPEELDESGIGMCHDVTRALLRRLRENRIRGTAVMLKGNHEPNFPTHSFVVTRRNGKYTVLDPLSYDSGYKGGYESMDDAISDRIEDWRKEDEKGDVVSSRIRSRDWKKRGLLDFLRYKYEKKASYSLKEDPTYEDAAKVFRKLSFNDRANIAPRHPDFLRDVPKDMLFDRQVAVDEDGNPVGFNEFYYGRNKAGRRQPPHNSLAVLPEARGHGLSKLMVEAAIRKARKEKIKRLVWEAFADNEPSIRAALSAGFEDATPKNAKEYRRFVYRVPGEKKASSLDLKKLFPSSEFPTEEELKKKEGSFSVGDRVKVSDHIRCRQKGHTGTIVRIDPEDKHGWKSFIVEFDDKKYGSMGFSSGNIDKVVEKKADIVTKLLPHQENAVRKALLGDIILAHSLGSGKTLSSIAAIDAIGKPATVLAPASLVENYRKELRKHKKGGPDVTVISLPTAVSKGYRIPKGNTVVIDEAHSLRNQGTKRERYVIDQLKDAGRVIALTGTPSYNDPYDIAQLVNIVSRKNVFPRDRSEFYDRYFDDEAVRVPALARLFMGVRPGKRTVINRRRSNELRDRLREFVDEVDIKRDLPSVSTEDIYVDMDPEQLDAYNYVTRNLPSDLLYKLRHNIAPNKTETKRLQAFLGAARQVSNTAEVVDLDAKGSRKLSQAVQRLARFFDDNKDARALVYSNYLAAGVYPYARHLDDLGLKYNMFTGGMSPGQKKRVVEQYNSGEVPIILGSGSASEGLDLKGTRLIQLLEPHWNNSRLDQVIGRGVRYKSHEGLPENERNVKVERYYSRLPEKGIIVKRRRSGVDEYLRDRSAEKQELIDTIRSLLEKREDDEASDSMQRQQSV